jgi:NAD(P)H-dependent nitrite reductase large subunit/NAD(P)H-dependent nitrite reductase small subunit
MAPQIVNPSSDEVQVSAKQVIVVVGNGMVGHRFLERMKRYDTARRFSLVSIGEEPIQHYNRMLLTEYFEHLSIEKLKLATSPEWYDENEIALKISSRATSIDVNSKTVMCQSSQVWDGSDGGDEVNANTKEFIVSYNHLVIATGATALVPNLKGAALKGVFVYRTIQDLNDIIAYGEAQREREATQGASKKYALVVGGGLLGLEAAKAIHDLKVSVRIINRGSRLMSRQLDDGGAKVLHSEITSKFGIEVLYHKSTKLIHGESDVRGVDFTDGSSFDDVFMIVFATGIKPRDDLAHTSGLEVAARGGGIQVNDYLETSAESVYAIGECVSHRDVTYGLVAPGYEMADSLAKNLASDTSTGRVLFSGSDSSTKLKLMGTEVASFGTYFPEDITEPFEELVYNNPLERVYKKLIFSADGKKLLGGIMVGDASDFPRLTLMCKMKDQKPLTESPNEILLGKRDSKGGGNAILDLPDEAQVCSCNNVTKGEMCKTIRDQKLGTLADVKKVCNVGTGCGGCMPMVKDLFEAELAAAGTAIDKSLCEHFAYSRQELYQIILVEKYETFTELLSKHGRKPNNPRQHGCEICKPTVASIFASLMNHHVLLGDRAGLQDTNDRFLANIQKSGQFSIVPRVAGGEITPGKLIVLGKVAKKYNLYSKITGGQRIDLFGAEKYDLPAIWQELVEAGFESGHAYGKSLRTVKSCVGSTWCRFGVQDAVGFAIFLEDRYKGVRSPHKIKGGVSGCTRECAEARGKDFGCIATEKGYNVYVCGNGGTNPKHAVLLAPDVPQDLCVKYLDRFLMYYIRTADRLQRTSKWLESLEGGIEQLRRVVIEDSLGIAATLEKQMEYLLNTYECEWKKVVETPELRAQFAQFRNTSATQQETAMVEERGQLFPVGKTALKRKVRGPSFDDSKPSKSPGGGNVDSPTSISEILLETDLEWIPFGSKELFDVNSGGAVLYGETQLAVFNITELYNGIERVSWFATQNMCPHDHAFVLAQGILGDADGRPKVVCPMHKKSYDLIDGSCMSGEEALQLETFRVKEDDDGQISLLLPPAEVLDARLGTSNFVHVSADVSGKSSGDREEGRRATRASSSSKPSSAGGCGSKSFDW